MSIIQNGYKQGNMGERRYMPIVTKQINKGKWVSTLLENLFLALTGVYLFWQFSAQTTFYLPYPGWLDRYLLATMLITAATRFFITVRKQRRVWISLILAGIFLMVYHNDGYRFLLYTAVLLVGLSGIHYQKILRTYVLTVGILFVTAVFAGVTGTITDFVYVGTGRGLRSAWGICYPTDFATALLFILMFLWAGWSQIPDAGMLVLCGSSLLISYYIAQSTTSFACGCLFALAILYHLLEKRIIRAYVRLRWIRETAQAVLTILFPLLGAGFFALLYLYGRNTSLGKKLDLVMHRRLSLAYDAWVLHGLKAFGTPFEQIGAGFSTFQRADYNFVDSSYPLILLRYGWVLLAALCVCWVFMTRKAIKTGNGRLALVMGLIAVHSFAEHHFIEPFFNILLVMPFADFTMGREESSTDACTGPEYKRLAAVLLTGGTVLCFCRWKGATFLSWVKTWFEVHHLTGGGYKSRLVIPELLVVMVVMALGIWSVYGLFQYVTGYKKTVRLRMVTLGIFAVIAVAGTRYMRTDFYEALGKQKDLLEADRGALTVITESAEGKVYSGVMPALYHILFPTVSYSAFNGEEMARLRGKTVLMRADTEYMPFINSDCLFTRISDQHAVYTDDGSVIQALTEAGYHMTGYYNVIKYVDLRREAERNGLLYTGEDGIKMEGPEASLNKGPYLNLRSGKYTVSMSLRLPEKPAGQEAALLSVTSEWGRKVLSEKRILQGDLDQDGRVTVALPFSVGDVQGVEFHAVSGQGSSVFVESIQYVRTPDADVHRFYDDQVRVIREEYYDRNGTPLVQNGGFCCLEQEYDADGNVAVRRFYDGEGNLALRSDGYAEVHWDYNGLKQIVREAFYDTEGKPAVLTSGQSANERIYDAAGNVICYTYYGQNGRPTLVSSGYAILKRQYDGTGRMIREEYYDADNEPILQSGGYTAIEQEYDEEGNVKERRFFKDGDLTLKNDGYAVVRWDYNEEGRVIREEFYGTGGEPVLNTSGVFANEREYDRVGNVTEYRYYGTEGLPVLTVLGYAQVKREFNEKNQIIREEYYGVEGEPIVCQEGYAAVERAYNEKNQKTEERLFNVDGDPAVISPGFSRIYYDYTEDGQLSLTHYVTEDGIPVEAGSACLHHFLENLLEKNYTVFVSVKDEGTSAITVTIAEDLKKLGIQTELRGRYRNSFLAVITPEGSEEKISATEAVTATGETGGLSYSIASAGYLAGSYSSIIVNGTEYSPNMRGLNFVVYDNEEGRIIAAIGFDTFTQKMSVTQQNLSAL